MRVLSMAGRPSLLILGLLALGSGPVSAGGMFTLETLVGVDTNPLEIQEDGPGAAYAEIRLATGGSVPLGRRAGLRFSGALAAREYDSSASDAGRQVAAGRIGFETVLGSPAARPVVLGFGVLASVDRSTFTDPATGAVYRVEAEPQTLPPSYLPIPQRFDTNTVGGFLDLDVRLGRRVSAFVSSTLESKDFVEEYGDRTALESLDHRLWTFEPGVRVSLHRTAALRVSVAATGLDYEEQPAIGSTGQAVAGVARSYRSTDVHVALSVVPAARVRLDVDVRGGDRADTYAGYYDLEAVLASVAGSYRPSWRTRLEIVASTRNVDYAHAPVTSADGRLRGSRADRLAGRFEYDLRRPTTVFGEGGVEQVENNDVVFAHDRSWIAVGVRYRP